MIDPYKKVDNTKAVNLNTVSMPQLFDLLNRTFQSNSEIKSAYELWGNRVMALYRSDPFKAHEGGFKTITEKDTSTYGNEQAEGSNPVLVKYGIGRTMTFTYTDYGNAYTATERALRDNKYPEIFREWIDLPKKLLERRNLDGVHRWTFANAASYTNMDSTVKDNTCIDGLAPVSAVHSLPHSAATWSNVVSGNPVFSKSGLLAAELLFKTNIKDGFGVQKRMIPDTIVSTDDPTTCYNIRQITGSTADVSSDNSTGNPAMMNALNKYKHIILPLLDSDSSGNVDATKSRIWFLGRFGSDGVDARYCEAVSIGYRMPKKDELNGNITQAVQGSWEFRIVSPRGFVASFAP